MNKEAESVGQKQEQGDGQAEDGQGGDEQAVDEQAGEAAGMVQLGVEVAALAAEAQAAEHALRQAGEGGHTYFNLGIHKHVLALSLMRKQRIICCL